MPITRFFLTAIQQGVALHYTGRSGSAWVSTDHADAYPLGECEARLKLFKFNRLSGLHGLTFSIVSA